MNNLYLPAEWERQRALQLTWPHKDTDWNYCLDEINNTYVEMADAITRYEPLIIVAPDTKDVERMLCGRLSEKGDATPVSYQRHMGKRPRLHLAEGEEC